MRDNFRHHQIIIITIVQLEDYGLVQFLPLDITNEDSVGELLLFIDSAIQFGEDEDVKVPKVLKIEKNLITGITPPLPRTNGRELGPEDEEYNIVVS